MIIASSPTCEFGRVLHHLKRSIEQPDDVIVFVGWTPPNTLGRRLQDGQQRVRIYDRWYDVKCQVRTIHGLSAHADGDELLRFLEPDAVAADDGVRRPRRGAAGGGLRRAAARRRASATRTCRRWRRRWSRSARSADAVDARTPGRTDND